MSEKRSRNWTFTWNNPSKLGAEIVSIFDEEVKKGRISYFIFQKEIAPETGTPHFQGYVQFGQAQRFSALKKLLSSEVHLEIANGSPSQNEAYCSKVESRAPGSDDEVGPWSGGKKREDQGRRNDIEGYMDAIIGGATDLELLENHKKEFAKYHKVINVVRRIKMGNKREPPVVVLFTGYPGCGKTHSAVQYAEKRGLDYWIRGPHKHWFEGYAQQPIAILDECDKYSQSGLPLGLFLRVLDKYPVDVEIKGATVGFTSAYIILTAVLPVNHWYPGGDEVKEQIERRITVWMHFDEIEDKWVNKTHELYRPPPRVKQEEPMDVVQDVIDLTL